MKLLDGCEAFTNKSDPIGFTVRDFWSFQFSNILHDPDQVAEFLVAKVLEQKEPYNKDSWTTFDIRYRGKRIEVKETAYYHPFNEPGKLSSARRFGIHKIKKNDGTYERANDIYVFCLLKGEDEESAWPLEVSHWEFYVVPTSVINRDCDNQKTISLSKVRTFVDAVDYMHLKETIDALIE